MKPFGKRGYLSAGLYLLFFIAAFCLTGVNHANAYQKNAADTVSTKDVQFTTIPTAADSLAAKKNEQAKLAKQKTVIKAVAPVAEKPKTLWEIFIAGFLGGFAAFLMPCIYPML